MAEVMIVNPRRRKRAKGTKRRRRRPRSTSTVSKTRTVYRNPRKKSVRRRRRRSFRRNPMRGLFGGLNLMDLAGGTGIGIGSRLLPGVLARYLPIPTTGYMSYLSQLGSGLALSYVVGNILKMKGIAKKGTEITIALVMSRAVNDLLLGGGGLSGLRGLGKRGAYLEGLRGRGGLAQGVYEPAVSTGDSPTSRMMSRYGKTVQFRGARG